MQTLQLTVSFAHIAMIAGIFGLSSVLAVLAVPNCTSYTSVDGTSHESCWHFLLLSEENSERLGRAYYWLCAVCAVGILMTVLGMVLARGQENMSMSLLYMFTGVFSVISIILAIIICCTCCLFLFLMWALD